MGTIAVLLVVAGGVGIGIYGWFKGWFKKAPTAEFSAQGAVVAGNWQATFDASTSLAAAGTTIVSYLWDFGDGTTGTGMTTVHTYTSGGTYTVTLTVTDNRGNFTTKTLDVTASIPTPPSAPTAAFVAIGTFLSVNFDASSSHDDGTIVGYHWDFGDGTTGSGISTTHVYAAEGIYSVTLTVTDNDALTDTVTQDAVALEEPPSPPSAPTAVFVANVSYLDVVFDASQSFAVAGAAITNYTWDFGDGTTGTGISTSHTYSSANTYVVSLTVTDSNNRSDTSAGPITTINEPPPSGTWKAGFVVVEYGSAVATQEELDRLNAIKPTLAAYFRAYTQEMASLDVSSPTIVKKDIPWYDGTTAPKYLKDAGVPVDDFDFIYIFHTPAPASGIPTGYWMQRNRVHGIGQTVWSGYFPTITRILGVVGPFRLPDATTDLNWVSWVFCHEIWHQWSWYWNYLEAGSNMTDHLTGSSSHITRYVRTDLRCPDAGGAWRDNGDGSWTYDNTNFTSCPDPYNVDLYMMGLIPKEQVNPVHLLVETASLPPDNGQVRCMAYEKLITIDQIIGAEGERWE